MSAKFVKFIDTAGLEVWVNPDTVRYATSVGVAHPNHTELVFAEDHALRVEGEAEAVGLKLSNPSP